jgi:hypothetical protein
MTTITIIVLLALFGGFIGFVIMLQMKEQARLEKLRKASLLNNQARQIRRYLDDFPPQYQPKDLRLWLFSCLVSVFDELLSLQPDESLKRRRSHAAQEMQEFQESKQKRKARAVNDELQVMELKRLFDSFDNFLNTSKEQKKIDSNSAFKYKTLLSFFRYKVSADHKGYLARQAFLMNKFEDAIELYKEAVSELEPIKEVPEADEARKKFQGYVDEIESDLLLQKQEEELMGDDEEEEDADDEWNKFIGKDDFEKKKYF